MMINASGKVKEARRRKALLDKETTSTNAPRLVFSDHNDEAENGPLLLVSRIRILTAFV
jgi:hypothetical protein